MIIVILRLLWGVCFGLALGLAPRVNRRFWRLFGAFGSMMLLYVLFVVEGAR